MSTSTISATTASQPAPASTPKPGHVCTLALKSGNYKVYVYIQETDGTKTYLPANFDPQSFEKVRSLTWGLLNAHDAQRQSLNEAPYELKGMNTQGLIKKDDTMVSHDFLIQPTNSLIADQMAGFSCRFRKANSSQRH